MQDDTILLFVEVESDAKIVSWILEAAHYPQERISCNILAGKWNASTIRFVRNFPHAVKERCAVLVDLDEKGSIPQAIQRVKEQLDNPPVKLFCAIPQIETWLFADEDKAIENASGKLERQIIQALPLPEEIENPKEIAQLVFNQKNISYEFVKDIDIERACARSPSLRHFLTGLSELLDFRPISVLESVPRSLNREVFSGLIREIVPAKERA